MRFQVPQFIEVEDKIFGPFTLKQFVYLAGGAGAVVICFSFLPKILAVFISAPIALISLALTFVKINNKPFVYTIEAFFKYYIGERLYIWKKQEVRPDPKKQDYLSPQIFVPKLSDSKLKDLSWTITVKNKPLENDFSKEETS